MPLGLMKSKAIRQIMADFNNGQLKEGIIYYRRPKGYKLRLSKEYMAGFFDGEGCVNFARSRRQTYLRIMIVNTNLEILCAFQNAYGGDISELSGPKTRPNWKQSWCWRLNHINAVRFLEDLLPWLVLKEQQALTAIAWLESRPGKGKRWDKPTLDLLCERMTWLNRRGPDKGAIDPATRVAEGLLL